MCQLFKLCGLFFAIANINVDAFPFQLVHQWKASTGGSILSIDVLVGNTPGQQVLASAGHKDDGNIRLWPFEHENIKDMGQSSIGVKVHDGGSSIFTLSRLLPDSSSQMQYLASGSFDRSAKIHRAVGGADFRLETIGALPEHTGWVRKVALTSFRDNQHASNSPIALSIGCNLINVWTLIDNEASVTEACNNAVRIARLDAGPSPDDPAEEIFRRHDILSFAIVEDSSNSYVVAGLVDGTVRAFRAKYREWYNRKTNNSSPYDATGSCDCAGVENDHDSIAIAENENPCISMNAHDGRVTAVLAIDGMCDFVTTGYDGRWIRWHIEEDGSTLIKTAEGCIPSVPASADHGVEGQRICSAVVIADKQDNTHTLCMATNSGCVYRTNLSNAETCEMIWKSDNTSCKVAAISHTVQDGCLSIFASTSDGMIMVFQQ